MTSNVVYSTNSVIPLRDLCTWEHFILSNPKTDTPDVYRKVHPEHFILESTESECVNCFNLTSGARFDFPLDTEVIPVRVQILFTVTEWR